MKRRGVKESDPYDWEKIDLTTSSSHKSSVTQPRNEIIHGNATQMTAMASHPSGPEYVSHSQCTKM